VVAVWRLEVLVESEVVEVLEPVTVDPWAVAAELPGMVAALTAPNRAAAPADAPRAPMVSPRSRRMARSRASAVNALVVVMASRIVAAPPRQL
jgi:hypothetical protein